MSGAVHWAIAGACLVGWCLVGWCLFEAIMRSDDDTWPPSPPGVHA